LSRTRRRGGGAPAPAAASSAPDRPRAAAWSRFQRTIAFVNTALSSTFSWYSSGPMTRRGGSGSPRCPTSEEDHGCERRHQLLESHGAGLSALLERASVQAIGLDVSPTQLPARPHDRPSCRMPGAVPRGSNYDFGRGSQLARRPSEEATVPSSPPREDNRARWRSAGGRIRDLPTVNGCLGSSIPCLRQRQGAHPLSLRSMAAGHPAGSHLCPKPRSICVADMRLRPRTCARRGR
jgi:hypothetical protein